MNEWGHLEQKREDQPKTRLNHDQLLRSEERDRATGRRELSTDLSAREQVERTADRIRDEFLLTLEELDRRRGRALDVRYQAMQHRDLIIGAVITAAVLTSIGVGVAIWRIRHRERILARQRLKAVKRAWAHPGRVASSAEQRPLAVEMGRKLILIFGSTLASAVAKNAVQGLVPQRRTQPAMK
jgi:hypothetical protein